MQLPFLVLLLLSLSSVYAFFPSFPRMLHSASVATSFRFALSKASFQTARAASTMSTAADSTKAVNTAYDTLTAKLKTITQLKRAKSVLEYDRLVFMPQAGASSKERGAQLAALAELIHEKETDPALGELIQQAEQEPRSDSDEMRLLELTKKDYEQNARISPELAGKVASLQTEAYSKWVEARKNDDYASFASTLHECFETAKEVAAAKSHGERSVYTQMLDDYETGMSKDRIDDIFDEIQAHWFH